MDEKTDDAISAAFREMEQADPEPKAMEALPAVTLTIDEPICCVRMRVKDAHAPSCPWLRRKQARERAEKAWKEREALVEKLLLEQIDACVCRGTGRIATRCRLCEDDTKDHECVDEPVRCVYCFGIRSILAALKGAPTT